MWSFPVVIHKAKPRKGKPFRTKDPKRITEMADRKAGQVHANLYHGIQTFKKRVSDEQLEHAWATGDWSRAMKVIPWDDLPGDIGPALEAVGQSTFAAGLVSMEALPANVNKHLRWDAKNPILRKYITDRTASLVVGIQGETQKIIQNAVARSFNNALTPREVAKQIKGSIGLFPKQEIALMNYQMKLQADGVTGTKLHTMVGKYEDHLLNYRAKMIARTEMRGATNQGQLSVWREASNQDLIDKRTARRVWIAEGPDPCDDCLEMDGEEVGIDDFWTMPDGTQVETPPWNVHPSCYCAASLII